MDKPGDYEAQAMLASAATPRIELERQIMDSNIPKNEREWWASREIEKLRDALEYYVCDAYGQCREIKLKDGSCIHADIGRCGKIAQDALRRSQPTTERAE